MPSLLPVGRADYTIGNKKPRIAAGFLENGGAEGDRTPDLCNAIAALSQLSYGPVRFPIKAVA